MEQSVSTGKIRLLPHNPALSTEYHTYTCYLAHIIACIQWFYDHIEYSEAQIAAEIAIGTQDHIHLHFLRQSTLAPVQPYVVGRRGFLVYWGDEIFGSLQIKLIGESHDHHILPVPLCERLAHDCGWGLYILEKGIQQQQQQQMGKGEAQQKVLALSPAQCTVLELMVKGYSTRVIAERLQLSKRTVETHQRNIYQVLDVHSQRGAVLVGLAAGLGIS